MRFPNHNKAYGPTAARPIWGIRELGYGLVGMAVSFGLALVALLSAQALFGEQSATVLISAFVFQAGLLTTIVVVLRYRPYGFNALLGPVQLGMGRKCGWAGFAFAAILLSNVVYRSVAGNISQELIPPPLPPELITQDLRWVGFAIIVILGPFAEEVFFRGLMFQGLIVRFGFWVSCAISATLFSLAHADIALLVPAFVSGLVLAFVFWRCGSLWPAILAHTTQNAVAFGLVM